MSDGIEQLESREIDRLSVEQRLNAAEENIRVLAEALRTLVDGLEPHPLRDDGGPEAAGRAAQHAHEQLLAAGL